MQLALRAAAILAAVSVLPASAQQSATLDVRLEVLPPVLTVTVSSAELDFASQRADAGHVELDPVTGEISGKASGRHALGEVSLLGPANRAYALVVDPWTTLDGNSGRIPFGLRWARNESCQESGFEELPGTAAFQGTLSAAGCASFRFGGAVNLIDTAHGQYAGRLRVRVIPL